MDKDKRKIKLKVIYPDLCSKKIQVRYVHRVTVVIADEFRTSLLNPLTSTGAFNIRKVTQWIEKGVFKPEVIMAANKDVGIYVREKRSHELQLT